MQVCSLSYPHPTPHPFLYISDDEARMDACALVGSRLDCANSVLLETTQKKISRFQKEQNLLARVFTRSPQSRSPLNTALTSK